MASVHREHPLLTDRRLIGSIKRVPLRDVWLHEAINFTTWLQDNLDSLSTILDVPLVSAEREQSVGSFNVDLVAEDASGNTVIIENQLEKSDHDHLGKLLTYLVSVDARAAIWIVADPRPEHVNVINWLNESSPSDFYLVKLEAICIDNSLPAPLFTRIVGPSEEARQIGDTKKDLAERHHIRLDFWKALLEQAKQKTRLHTAISPGTENWISASAGKAGLYLNYVVLQHSSRVELDIDTGDHEGNERIFQTLTGHKHEIESSFGAELHWDQLEGRRSMYIRHHMESGGYRDEQSWPVIHAEMIDAMIKLENALRPFIKQIS